MEDTLQMALNLVGGLAIFIFGMNMMSEYLQKIAGERMRSLLALLTRNPVMGVLAGAVVTAVLQSSSATTVMTIGFVSAGLMGLPQAISIILGANIGTTITAQIIAFKISRYIMAFIFVGFVMGFFAKNETVKNSGKAIFAFGLLFLGIETMGGAMKPLASSDFFATLIEQVSGIPILGVGVGTLMTLVVQSSSATIAVLQNLAAQPGPDGTSSLLGLTGAIPILLGDNIGTTITAILASIGASRDAKRVAVSHCVFNISGALIFVWLIGPYASLIQAISPAGPEIEVISRQIANAHTIFNATMTLIWLPLIPIMVRIASAIIPTKKTDGEVLDLCFPQYLDDHLTGQPTAAIQLATRETARLCDGIADTMGFAAESVNSLISAQAEMVRSSCEQASELNHRIMNYMAEIFNASNVTEEQASHCFALLEILNDAQQANERCLELVQGFEDKDYSETANARLVASIKQVRHLMQLNAKALDGQLESNLLDMKVLAQDSVTVDNDLMRDHLARVNQGKCSSALTIPFSATARSMGYLALSVTGITRTILKQA